MKPLVALLALSCGQSAPRASLVLYAGEGAGPCCRPSGSLNTGWVDIATDGTNTYVGRPSPAPVLIWNRALSDVESEDVMQALWDRIERPWLDPWWKIPDGERLTEAKLAAERDCR